MANMNDNQYASRRDFLKYLGMGAITLGTSGCAGLEKLVNPDAVGEPAWIGNDGKMNPLEAWFTLIDEPNPPCITGNRGVSYFRPLNYPIAVARTPFHLLGDVARATRIDSDDNIFEILGKSLLEGVGWFGNFVDQSLLYIGGALPGGDTFTKVTYSFICDEKDNPYLDAYHLGTNSDRPLFLGRGYLRETSDGNGGTKYVIVPSSELPAGSDYIRRRSKEEAASARNEDLARIGGVIAITAGTGVGIAVGLDDGSSSSRSGNPVTNEPRPGGGQETGPGAQ